MFMAIGWWVDERESERRVVDHEDLTDHVINSHDYRCQPIHPHWKESIARPHGMLSASQKQTQTEAVLVQTNLWKGPELTVIPTTLQSGYQEERYGRQIDDGRKLRLVGVTTLSPLHGITSQCREKEEKVRPHSFFLFTAT